MIAITYVSAATDRFTNQQLLSLLKQAHRHNGANNITGLLLYNNAGTFLQVLEGEPEVVDALYNSIMKDPRHKRINKISRKTITERTFPHWKMGFRNITNMDISNIDGYSNFLQDSNSSDFLTKNANFSLSLLNHFKKKSEEILL
jgi:hypothetical protein